MSASAKQQNAELWRVAESGDVDELARVVANGAQINARNKHGMTALMKAAYHGNAQMVRALLERGADPNSVRNDKFTALALAAFFGHTETVKILIDHGAKPGVITRCGASAQTWATRRTYVEAARCLESHAPTPEPEPVCVPAAAAPVVIKTLKDPPEIWDLVHESPKGGFSAGSAFVSRLTSMKRTLAFRIAAMVVVSSACVVGVLVLKGSQARSLSVEPPAKQNVVANEVSAPVSIENGKSETAVEQSAPQPDELSHHSESLNGNDKSSRKGALTRQTRTRAVVEEEPAPSVQSREVQAPAPVIASPQAQPRSSASNKPDTSLSPQLIAPAKSASPKGKVIQWP